MFNPFHRSKRIEAYRSPRPREMPRDLTGVPIAVDPPADNIRGVRPRVALAIADILVDGRRCFGSSGASLTRPAADPAYVDLGVDPERAKAALSAERDTTAVLQRWIEDKPGAVLVDSVHIRGWGEVQVNEATGLVESGDTDHIILVGSEVILIDTKLWKSAADYSVGDGGEALRAGKPFPGGNVAMPKAIHAWLDYLHEDASITGIVCINAAALVLRNRNWYTKAYRLVEIARLVELLDEKWCVISDYDKTHINSTLVAQVAVACVKPQ